VSSGKRFVVPLSVAIFDVSRFIEFQKGTDQKKPAGRMRGLPALRSYAARTTKKAGVAGKERPPLLRSGAVEEATPLHAAHARPMKSPRSLDAEEKSRQQAAIL